MAALTPKEDDAWALSKLVPEVRGTPLDLGLTQVVFVAASQDNPEVGTTICSNYSVRNGMDNPSRPSFVTSPKPGQASSSTEQSRAASPRWTRLRANRLKA